MRISDWSSDECSSDLAHRFDPDVHLGEHRLHHLEVGNGFAELLALPGVIERQRQRALGDAEIDRRDHRALEIEAGHHHAHARSEEHTSELQSLMRISYAVFCLKKKKKKNITDNTNNTYTIIKI